ncbi:hypothetical protein FRUB_03477 [Fimbriiglobus ruber]|uniref:Uncharacterized protein n=1 Tax=Fimbriiglobus ruber TaxID=1908690 RepID=A0A225DZD0_9BACT|nr:hypothetical protein FRUB_03477 [Fimbriiglobus ruber]
MVSTGCAAAVGLFAGCAAIPPLENPVLVRPDADVENPILVAPGAPTPAGYAEVVERTLDALDDYFDIKPGSRLSGIIETLPRTAPGFEQFWKPGTPDNRERLWATFQSIRHYAIVRIEAGERGGFRVYVEVYKELEDLPRPAAAATGGAIFREEATVDRRVEAATPVAVPERNWIPKGRDPAFEQVILRKIQRAMYR